MCEAIALEPGAQRTLQCFLPNEAFERQQGAPGFSIRDLAVWKNRVRLADARRPHWGGNTATCAARLVPTLSLHTSKWNRLSEDRRRSLRKRPGVVFQAGDLWH